MIDLMPKISDFIHYVTKQGVAPTGPLSASQATDLHLLLQST